MYIIYSVLLFVCPLFCEEPLYLNNVRQITFDEMGFQKSGEGYFSPDDQSILFQAIPKNSAHYQIYGLRFEEGVPRLVSTGAGACTCAYFRSDGQKIIFASSHASPLALEDPKKGSYSWALIPYMNIYEANPDGTELKELTSGSAYHAECAYSPDGTEIVYASNETGSMNLFIMNADGSGKRQLTHHTHCYNGGPFFSPDGKKILFRADREKPHYLQIYLLDKESLEERQLTANEDVNWAPYFHPNGRVIAYTRSVGHGKYEIFLQNIETGVEMRLTHDNDFNGLPVFSNQGDQLLWTSKRDTGSCQLFLADFTLPEELE
jgi:TolB protein